MITGNNPHAAPKDAPKKDAGPEASDDLFQRLIALPSQSDRATLVKTIDSAVATVLERLRGRPPGAPLGDDLVRLTRSALAFLEACSSLHDAEFAKQNKIWASRLQEAFATAAGLPSAAEPTAKKKPAASESRPAKPRLKPTEVFEATLCSFVRRRSEAFEVMGRNDERLPFILAPAFSVVFEQLVKTRFVPVMAANRRIKGVLAHLDAADPDRGLLELYAESGDGNVVRAIWDEMWDDIGRRLLTPETPKATPPQARRKPEKKASWLDRFGLGKSRDDDEDEDPEDAARDTSPKPDPELAKQVWQALEAGAVDGNFHPPLITDVPVFRALFDFDVDAVDEAKLSVRQLLQQESEGKAREGVTRDFLNQQFKLLPAPCGEILALWTYFQQREQFNYKILRSFQASHGQTAEQRRKFLPLFMRWVPDFTTVKVKI